MCVPISQINIQLALRWMVLANGEKAKYVKINKYRRIGDISEQLSSKVRTHILKILGPPLGDTPDLRGRDTLNYSSWTLHMLIIYFMRWNQMRPNNDLQTISSE